MKEIKLTQGFVAMVDDEDYHRLSAYRWYTQKSKHGLYYARRNHRGHDGKTRAVYMHREITGAAAGECVDHINHNTLDNRGVNLRTCTQSENMKNQNSHRGSSSKYLGVYRHKCGKWQAHIRTGGNLKYLGLFESDIIAAAALKYHGAFANPNVLPGPMPARQGNLF